MSAHYDAIVYDLDGTLVRLETDWEAARQDAAAVLEADTGVDAAEMGLWDILETAETNGVVDTVSDAIAAHERDGAREATRLGLADELPRAVPIGVCSLNSESACRLALEVHDLADHVGAVVGRDTLDAAKPDPRPLLQVLEMLSAAPERSLFVGDTDRDALTAERAGVEFVYTANRLADSG